MKTNQTANEEQNHLTQKSKTTQFVNKIGPIAKYLRSNLVCNNSPIKIVEEKHDDKPCIRINKLTLEIKIIFYPFNLTTGYCYRDFGQNLNRWDRFYSFPIKSQYDLIKEVEILNYLLEKF